MHWPGGNGRPVVLLHGLASNARIWEKVAPRLAADGLAPLAPDLRGHGLTDRPDGDYGFATYRADLAFFIQALELDKPLLVGHSWGAMVALDYAARFPIGPKSPAGIVLIDGGMTQLNDMSGATWETVRQRMAPPRLSGMTVETFVAMLQRPGRAWQLDEQDVSIYLANFEVDEEERIHPRLTFERHMQIVEAMWGFETYSQFRKITCPVLLLPAQPPQPRSDGDEEYLALKRRGVERILEANPQVKLEWLVDAVHDAPLQNPGAVAQKIADFAGSTDI